MTVQATLFSLAKYDNGMFKSDKQRDFILSQCDAGGLYIVNDSVYGNPVQWFIQCDRVGIVNVVKETRKETTKTFQRATGKDADTALQSGIEMRAKNACKKELADKANKALTIANKYSTDHICKLMTEKKINGDVLVSIVNKKNKIEEFGMTTLKKMDNL